MEGMGVMRALYVRASKRSFAQSRQPVRVALLDRRGIGDLLAQVAAGQVQQGVAALAAQGIRVGKAGAGFVARVERAVAQRFPGRCAGALGDGGGTLG